MALFAWAKELTTWQGEKARLQKDVAQLKQQINTALAFDDGAVGTINGQFRPNNYKSYLECIKIPNVYKALSVIAYNYAAVPLRVVTDEDKPQDVDLEAEAPDLAALLKRPNPLDKTGFTFLEKQAMDLILTGNHIVAMTDLDGWGRPHQLYRMRPDQVRVLVGDQGSMTYAFNAGSSWGYGDTYDADTEVLHWKFANVLDPIWGLGAVEAGESVFARDKLINDFIRAYFERGAVPLGAITVPKSLTEQEYNKIIRRFRGMIEAGRAVFKTGVLEDGATYKTYADGLASLPVVALATMSRNDVFQLLGVPPQKAGDFANTTYRNAEQADAFFADETMDPLWTRGEPEWTRLVKLWNTRWKAIFDRPTVPVNIEHTSHAAYFMAQAGAYRRNDIRGVTGHAPFPEDDPLGEEIIMAHANTLAQADATPLDQLPANLTSERVASGSGDQD